MTESMVAVLVGERKAAPHDMVGTIEEDRGLPAAAAIHTGEPVGQLHQSDG